MGELMICWPRQMAARSPCQLQISSCTALGACWRASVAADEVSKSARRQWRERQPLKYGTPESSQCLYRMPPCWHAPLSRGPQAGLSWAARTARSMYLIWPPAEGSPRSAVHLAPPHSVLLHLHDLAGRSLSGRLLQAAIEGVPVILRAPTARGLVAAGLEGGSFAVADPRAAYRVGSVDAVYAVSHQRAYCSVLG